MQDVEKQAKDVEKINIQDVGNMQHVATLVKMLVGHIWWGDC